MGRGRRTPARHQCPPLSCRSCSYTVWFFIFNPSTLQLKWTWAKNQSREWSWDCSLQLKLPRGLPVWSHPCPRPMPPQQQSWMWAMAYPVFPDLQVWLGFFLSDLWCGHQYYSTGVFWKLVAALSNQTRRRCFRSPRNQLEVYWMLSWVCWGLHPSLAQSPRPLIPSTDLSSHIPLSWVHFLHTQHSLVVSGETTKTTTQYTWVLHRGDQR